MSELEIKKMKQGMSYSKKEKTIILNVFKYFRNEYPDKCITEIVRRTSKATGCSEKSIFHFRKEEASPGGFKERSKTKIRKNININSRLIKYDINVRTAIKNVIYDFKFKNIVPSVNMIRRAVNNDNTLPNFSSMTLRRLLFDMGFYYEKNGTKSILVEKNDTNGDIKIKENLPVPIVKEDNINKAVEHRQIGDIPAQNSIQSHVGLNNHIYHPMHHRMISEQPQQNGPRIFNSALQNPHGSPMILNYNRINNAGNVQSNNTDFAVHYI